LFNHCLDKLKEKQMRSTSPADKVERDNWNAEANRRAKHWLIWTLLLLVVAYFLPLRWAVLFALFYARIADPDLKLADLPFAFPVPYLFRPPRRNTIFATSVVLKDESSGDTRARLHTLDNGEPALSLYGNSGEETFAFTSRSETSKADTVGKLIGRLENETSGLERRLVSLEACPRQLEEIKENLHELQSRLEQLTDASGERNEKVSSHSFELLDDEGKARARLQISSEDQPHLAFYDGNGLSRASLSLMENGYPQLFLTNLYESSLSPSEGGSNRGRIVLGFDDEGYPQLLMYDDPQASGFDPALNLAVQRAEWVGQGETRYQSKTASLLCDVSLGGKQEMKFFGARVVEPAPGESS
jgi:hypothetical protein